MMVLGCILIIVGLIIGGSITNNIDLIDKVIESHPEVVDKDSMRNKVIGIFVFISLLLSLGGIALII